MVVWALGSINAGANYGTGYCDVKYYDMKFITIMGSVKYGTCCTEMDIREANGAAIAYTPYPWLSKVGSDLTAKTVAVIPVASAMTMSVTKMVVTSTHTAGAKY